MMDISALLSCNQPFIGGNWLRPGNGVEIPHIDPNTGAAVGTRLIGGAREIDLAVTSAASAQKKWMSMSPQMRQGSMLKWMELLQLHDESLMQMAALESGTPLSTPTARLAQAWIRYYAGWIDKIDGAVTTASPAPGLNIVRKVPYGVIGIIIPWNGPIVAMAMNCAPALAAGNAVVVKPPSATPFVALKMAALAVQAGMPPGLLNVVPGDAEAGEALVRHPGVAKIAFTGGAGVARQVMGMAALELKPVFLELGGKSPNILCEEADLDQVVPLAAGACLGLAGQGCVNPTRMLVHDAIYHEVVARLEAFMPYLRVGSAFLPDTLIGPVISERACSRILSVIDRAKAEGQGRLIFGGRRSEATEVGPEHVGGHFIKPALFVDVDPAASLAREEIFGPVLSVLRFKTYDEALAIANNTCYGLGAYIMTRNLGHALTLAEGIDAGYVNINSPPVMNPDAPFGGMKQSGFGRVGGREGLEEFLQNKNIFIPYSF